MKLITVRYCKIIVFGTTYYFDTYCLFDTGSYTIHLEKLNATELSLGDFDIVNIAYPDEHKYYKFIPDETGLYHVYTTDRSEDGRLFIYAILPGLYIKMVLTLYISLQPERHIIWMLIALHQKQVLIIYT